MLAHLRLDRVFLRLEFFGIALAVHALATQ
jgi:hypothetical protein